MKLALEAARTRTGGAILRFLFAHLSFLLPVRKVFESKNLLGFYHPKPSYSFHILIVPKRALCGIEDMEAADLAGLCVEVYQAARTISADLNAMETELVVNAGEFQDVSQVHFHLIGRE